MRGQSPPETELRKFVRKVGYHWDSCTLEDLETLKGVITRKFFLPGFAFQLGEIMEGSITITWLVPVTFVKTLQEAIETTSSVFFMEQNIETVTVDGKECYSSPTSKIVDYPEEQYTFQSKAEPQLSEKPPVQPPAFASSYSVQSQQHPSHSPPWTVPYYCPPQTMTIPENTIQPAVAAGMQITCLLLLHTT